MMDRRVVRFEALDSLRGVCACAVALYHLKTVGWITNLPIVTHGYLFVDFFFVLSGFVIMQSYGPKLSSGEFPLGKFMLLRLGRVYPLHLLMLFAFLAIRAVGALGGARGELFTPPQTASSLVANLFLYQIFVPPAELLWNIPSWSIVAELWTYLIVGLTLVAARGIARYAILALTIFGAYAFIVVVDHPEAPVHAGALARCLYGFGLGCTTSWLWTLLPARGNRGATVLEIAVVAAALLYVCTERAGYLTAGLLFAVLVLVFAADRGAVSRLLRRRLPVLLGLWSYSIYMVHYFVERRGLDVLALLERIVQRPLLIRGGASPVIAGPPLFADAAAIATLAGVVAVAACTYRLVEVPGRLWSRRRVLGERKSPDVAIAERVTPTF